MERDTYRLGVGLMIVNKHKKVLVGKRMNRPSSTTTPSQLWQLPQGGIDAGEDPESAVFREMQEEIGTTNGRIVAASVGLLQYAFPNDIQQEAFNGLYQGQLQRWFLIEFLGNDSEINVQQPLPEFDAWKWVDPNELVVLVVPFKRTLYQEITAIFAWYFR
ncbi:MAG TPA: RNA pyrophosphohydrolase [Amoebophilaceae bacterium]|nr:RNA pyrophosphohydrolase [Amoebophilaceae bacterium]